MRRPAQGAGLAVDELGAVRFKAKLDEQAIGAGKLLRNLTPGRCSLSGQNLCLRCLFLGFSCLGQPILTLFVGLHSLFALLLELRETGAQGIECGSASITSSS
jgi:hypothetical protein